MAKINVLPPQVADMIAAGEVVERPGSVIKELIENAIDAGASSVITEIQKGGLTYMRVRDNGSGMSREDAQIAFQRHATSKIKDEYGLEAISTLGFRGEALAAIASVSRIELLTRERGAPEGTAISLEAGIITDISPAGCPEGTDITIRDLFFNTPARLKFMKKDSAEAANVANIFMRLALSNPECAFKYVKDGREEASTPGNGNIKDCIYSLLGRDFALELIELESSTDDMRISGYITTPLNTRGNRSAQCFFVNGRYVRSQILQTAFEQAYRSRIFTGRFPGCVLFLNIKLTAVDVNVHPAKTEVKFLYERAIFDSVYYAVKSALDEENKTPPIDIPSLRESIMNREPELIVEKPEVKPDFYQNMTIEQFKEKKVYQTTFNDNKTTEPPTTAKTIDPLKNVVTAAIEIEYSEESLNNSAVPEPTYFPESTIKPAYRIIGEVFQGYIIVESGSEFMLIDKHAAHERLLFDKLKAEKQEGMMPQILLSPVIVKAGNEDYELLLNNLEILNKIGFDIEDFGDGTVLVRQLPAEVEYANVAPLVAELCTTLRLGGKPGTINIEDEILSSIACKAAIKIGKNSEYSELEALVREVVDGNLKYCPHGRPVAIAVTKEQLEKNFKRK